MTSTDDDRPSSYPTDGVDLSRLPSDVADALVAMQRATAAVIDLDRRAMDGRQAAAVAAVLADVRSRLGVAHAVLLPVIEADGLWAVDGARSLTSWVARRHGLAHHTAARQVDLGRKLRDDLSKTAEAALAGEMTHEQAQVLATHTATTDARRAALSDPDFECNETFLVGQARNLSVDGLRLVARRWAAYADPDADDRGYVAAADREYLELSRALDGYHLAGLLTLEHGQALLTALEAVTPVPAAGDERTSSQRRGQALGDLANAVLTHGLAGTGRAARPHLNVVVDFTTLQWLTDRAAARDAVGEAARPGTCGGTCGATSGGTSVGMRRATCGGTCGATSAGAEPVRRPAATGAGAHADPAAHSSRTFTPAMVVGDSPAGGPQFEDGTPIPRALLDRLACDSDLTRIVFGPRSQVIDVGRAERTFTGPRRTALVVRDKHCRYPGCTAPPALSEGHHIKHWVRDHGDTSVTNGILLCWFHHDLVHRRGIEIRRRADGWVFTDRFDRPIDVDGADRSIEVDGASADDHDDLPETGPG